MQTRVSIIIYISFDPRPIRLQLNARSPPRPGIDCIWACIWACAACGCCGCSGIRSKRANIPEQGGANRKTNSVCKHTYSVKSPLNHKELRVIGLFFASLVCHIDIGLAIGVKSCLVPRKKEHHPCERTDLGSQVSAISWLPLIDSTTQFNTSA